MEPKADHPTTEDRRSTPEYATISDGSFGGWTAGTGQLQGLQKNWTNRTRVGAKNDELSSTSTLDIQCCKVSQVARRRALRTLIFFANFWRGIENMTSTVSMTNEETRRSSFWRQPTAFIYQRSLTGLRNKRHHFSGANKLCLRWYILSQPNGLAPKDVLIRFTADVPWKSATVDRIVHLRIIRHATHLELMVKK